MRCGTHGALTGIVASCRGGAVARQSLIYASGGPFLARPQTRQLVVLEILNDNVAGALKAAKNDSPNHDTGTFRETFGLGLRPLRRQKKRTDPGEALRKPKPLMDKMAPIQRLLSRCPAARPLRAAWLRAAAAAPARSCSSGASALGTVEAKPRADAQAQEEPGVGDLPGGRFNIKPLRRKGEDATTMRARLLCSLPLSCRLLSRLPTRRPPT